MLQMHMKQLLILQAKVSQGLYEPNYLMCGDDRVNTYTND